VTVSWICALRSPNYQWEGDSDWNCAMRNLICLELVMTMHFIIPVAKASRMAPGIAQCTVGAMPSKSLHNS